MKRGSCHDSGGLVGEAVQALGDDATHAVLDWFVASASDTNMNNSVKDNWSSLINAYKKASWRPLNSFIFKSIWKAFEKPSKPLYKALKNLEKGLLNSFQKPLKGFLKAC